MPFMQVNGLISMMPEKEVSGAVYFEREPPLGALSDLNSSRANVPGSAAARPIVDEIPFRGDEINRQ
jgi:hypothetical protein